MSPILEARRLEVDLEGRPSVLRGIDLQLGRGEVLGIVGANGAGKSTLLRALGGLVPSSEGGVFLYGAPISRLSRREVARQIAFLPQTVPPDLPFTALEVVRMGRSPHLGPLGLESEADDEIAWSCLRNAEAEELGERPFRLLSGGERQRVLLARAMAQEAPVWLLDEFTSHLDLGNQGRALRIARDHASSGGAVVAVLHDLTQAARLCDRLALLHRGALLSVGEPAEVLDPEQLETCFGLPFSRGILEGSEPVLVPRWSIT